MPEPGFMQPFLLPTSPHDHLLLQVIYPEVRPGAKLLAAPCTSVSNRKLNQLLFFIKKFNLLLEFHYTKTILPNVGVIKLDLGTTELGLLNIHRAALSTVFLSIAIIPMSYVLYMVKSAEPVLPRLMSQLLSGNTSTVPPQPEQRHL